MANSDQSSRIANSFLIAAIILVVAATIFFSYKILQSKPGPISPVSNNTNTQINQNENTGSVIVNVPLKSVHNNIKVTDPSKVTIDQMVSANARIAVLGQQVYAVTSDDDMKTMAIYYRGNDTDDARHVLQAIRIQTIQQALRGYFGINGAYPDSLAAIKANWKAIQAYCIKNKSICNSSTLQLDTGPEFIDFYTDQPYIYQKTTDDFTVKYFMTTCDSAMYCADDDKIFTNGVNIMTKDYLSELQAKKQ